MILKLPYESVEACILNRDISETMYHALLETSMEIAKERSQNIDKYDLIPLQIKLILIYKIDMLNDSIFFLLIQPPVTYPQQNIQICYLNFLLNHRKCF
mmetsp:Transcript_34552/g.79786  ORF Transcript_34552/g.79786 Transcript_34552/m.79786 type:complete len:99 (-) Transcript_34552:137-433(-)